MRIGIIGAGSIGSTLARRLSRAGHDVTVANSRAPETVDSGALRTGARAVWAAEVAPGAEVVITSVAFGQVPAVARLVQDAPATAVVIDTSNYFPHRDGEIDGVGEGQTESAWVQARFGRPVVKAWNSITADSLLLSATEPGAPGRFALPVAADDDAQRALGMALVTQTGFDAVDSGPIAESWRQQPGTPAYTTDLSADLLPGALERADARRAANRRDLFVPVLMERIDAEGGWPGNEYHLALARAVFFGGVVRPA